MNNNPNNIQTDDYVDAYSGRGYVTLVDIDKGNASIAWDGGTTSSEIPLHRFTKVVMLTNATIYGQEVDWSESDEGHQTIYEMAPNLIPADQAARVIYELRLDVTRLNSEAIDYFERLKKVRTFADEQVKGH